MRGMWFNQPCMINKFENQQTVLFSSNPKWKTGRWEFGNPEFQDLDNDAPSEVQPRYHPTATPIPSSFFCLTQFGGTA